jgi:protein involved in polysaccharide export with SLBB domain
MPMIALPKTGKLIPGDTLSIAFFRPPEDKLDGVLSVKLAVAVADDGTITLPVLDKVPAAGLNIMELNSALKARYAAAFVHPPFGFTTSTPPRVAVGYLGQSGGIALDKMIARASRLK